MCMCMREGSGEERKCPQYTTLCTAAFLVVFPLVTLFGNWTSYIRQEMMMCCSCCSEVQT